MLRRILAWVLLVGFVLLLLNIVLFQYYLETSILAYLIIAIWFIFTHKPLPSRKKKKASKITTEEATEEVPEEVTQETTEQATEEITEKAIEKNTGDATKKS